ncbi:hypothetical protein [Serpentinicella alkaliphila]|uniref:Uncharacterized protein n=1 Tax=Serpentinicella alkaliphila TaxID=1734049 RepID=A0A4R2TI32_9FIRM|nr:hypothetical protein [Serpentinicella alkaliphila]QUH25892.1 hypothetical protein HZR23_09190 [Serpentinicella alkaliphila]TCQ01957.1 hypothetical protein EDD79_102013 [Serpentinicella alkaliphila]
MIKAYLVGIGTPYENEDITVRYRVLKDESIILEKDLLMDYSKPLIVSHTALLTLMRDLEKLDENDILIIINDAALFEQIRGTSTTKNRDVLKMARIVKETLNRTKKTIKFKDVSGNQADFIEWNEKLKF